MNNQTRRRRGTIRKDNGLANTGYYLATNTQRVSADSIKDSRKVDLKNKRGKIFCIGDGDYHIDIGGLSDVVDKKDIENMCMYEIPNRILPVQPTTHYDYKVNDISIEDVVDTYIAMFGTRENNPSYAELLREEADNAE